MWAYVAALCVFAYMILILMGWGGSPYDRGPVGAMFHIEAQSQLTDDYAVQAARAARAAAVAYRHGDVYSAVVEWLTDPVSGHFVVGSARFAIVALASVYPSPATVAAVAAAAVLPFAATVVAGGAAPLVAQYALTRAEMVWAYHLRLWWLTTR